jgi:sulfite oxidase
VYEVGGFAGDHPGGSKILQATGKSVELFWQQSEPHNRAGAPETLEEMRVGNLSQRDFDWMEEVKSKALSSADWSRNEALRKLFFLEGATPSPPPEVDVQTFALKVAAVDGQEASLSLEALKARFKQHQVTTTIRCATPQAGGKGVSIARVRVPAEWSGVLLADVIESTGGNTAGVEQVRFEALDTDAQGRPFGAAIPVTTALDRGVGVLLAYEMDGAPIPKEHGFPLRVVVPGKTGARNVKFVHRIILS